MRTIEQDLVVVGFGPAGLAAAVQAREAGYESIRVIDPSPNIGSGGLAGIGIRSNSPGDEFTSPYRDVYKKVLRLDEARPLVGIKSPVKLTLATPFLRSVACSIVRDGSVQLSPERAVEIKHTPNGWHVSTPTQRFVAPQIVLAGGGKENILPTLENRDPSKVFTTHDIFSDTRLRELKAALAVRSHVAIIGNRHGAYSASVRLLNTYPGVSIDILKLSPTKPYFESTQEAADYGYGLTALDSICPDTGRINRFNGIRGEARQLWIEEQEGNHAEKLRSHTGVAIDEIDSDVVVIQATGYTARRLPLVHEDGSPLHYEARATPNGYAVLHDEEKRLVPHVATLGIGQPGPDATNVYHDIAREVFAQTR